MKFLFKLIPWFFVALFGAEIIAVMMPKKDGEYHVREFGRLPVLLNGRIQPFDSVARNALLQIRSTGRRAARRGAVLEVLASPEEAQVHRVAARSDGPARGRRHPPHLPHPPPRTARRTQAAGQGHREVRPALLHLQRAAAAYPGDQRAGAQGRRGQGRGPDQLSRSKSRKLANAVSLYQRLKVTLQPEGADDFAQELAEFQKNLGPARAAAQASESGKDFDKQALQRIAEPVQEFQLMAQFGYPLTVPPLNPGDAPDHWQNMGASLLESGAPPTLHPAVTNFAAMATAYHQHKPESLQPRRGQLTSAWLTPTFPKELTKGRAEFYFNDVKPFLHAMIIYLFAFVLACGGLLTFRSRPICPSPCAARRFTWSSWPGWSTPSASSSAWCWKAARR